MRDELTTAAFLYHDEGYFVIPCRHGTKRPLIKWGPGAKRLSRSVLAKFWDTDDDPPSIAVKLRAEDLVIDLDPQNNPNVAGLYDEMMKTRCATTPNGGLHAWFRISKTVRPRAYRGLDVLTKGRMVMMPPDTGREWVGPDKVVTLDDPESYVTALLDMVGIDKSSGEHLATTALAALEPIPVHRRNQTLTAIAGVLRAAGFRGNRLEAALGGIAERVAEQPENDPFTFEDAVKICESIDWRTPHPFDSRDFLRYEFNTKDDPPPLRWLIRDFLPAEGVTSIFGMGKQGKSYIAMEVLRCLSLCQPFLDLDVPTSPVRCLYVDWEKRGASLRRRLHALAKDDKLDITVVEPHGALVNMIEPLRAEIALGGFEFVIIDSLTIAIMQGDVNEAATVVPAMFALNSLGCPVMVLDHTKKPLSMEPYESLSAFGSVFKGNVCSMNWRLKKVTGDPSGLRVVLQHVTNNYDALPPDLYALIRFEFDDHGSLERASITRQELEELDDGVWRFLSYQVEPMQDTEVAKTLGLTVHQTRRALHRLLDEHMVQQSFHGSDKRTGYWEALQQTKDEDDE